MNKSEADEPRKIMVESKAIGFFFAFILIEGYILISASIGSFPFAIEEYTYRIIMVSPEGLYALYWIGILCLILGLLLGKYNRIYPPVALIGSFIFFIIAIL